MPDAAAPAAAAPADVPVSKEGYVWYFAYGSNMNAKVLTGRRNVHPINSVPAKLDGYVLGFNLLGIPYTEPGMATIQPITPLLRAKAAAALPANSQHTNGHVNGAYANGTSPTVATATAKPRLTSEEAFALRVQAGLHGVLHLITKDDWEIVKATEGVRLKGIGYQVVHVDCTLYDGRTIPALTLQAAPVSSGDIKHFLPSVRYLNIIRDGAREYGVDPAYCAMLERHPAYEVQLGVATSLAKAGLTGTGIALFMPLVPVLLGAAAVKRASKLLGFSTSTPAPATSTRSASPDPTPADGMASTRHKEQPEPAATVLQEPASNGVDGSGRGAASPAGAVSPGAAASGAAGNQAPASSSSGSGNEARPPPLFKMLSMMREVLDPRVTSFYMWGMFRGMWFVHDWVMSPLLGSGRDNDHVVRAARAAAARSGAAVKQD